MKYAIILFKITILTLIALITGCASDLQFVERENESISKQQFADAASIEMQFAFIVKQNYAQDKIIKSGAQITAGETYKLYVKPSNNIYLYIFNIDSTNKINLIFPDDKNISARNPLRRDMEYYIPERRFYTFSQSSGKELFYVLAFNEQPDNLEMMIKQINSNTSSSGFSRELESMYSSERTNARNSAASIITSNTTDFHEILTGRRYVMKIYEFRN